MIGFAFIPRLKFVGFPAHARNWLGYNDPSKIQYGIEHTTCPRKHRINENFFKTWSSDMAYILGFWFADGCIKKGRIFIITQHIKDKYLLKRILNSMNAKHYLYTGKNRHKNICNIYITSKTIYDDIIKLGGTEKKSLTIDFPKIPEQYMPDFLRGNFDGDGSIFFDSTNKKYLSCFVSASQKFINKMKKIFEKNKIFCKIVEVKRKNRNIMYCLRFNPFYTRQLGFFIYKNNNAKLIKMKRKYKIFQKAWKTTNGKDYSNINKN